MRKLFSNPRTAQILLTVGVLEFFGPILRDIGETHLLNPTWVGHARFHLMWLLVFMALSGVANLVLIWRWGDVRSMYVAWAWQACNVLGFWGAAALVGQYDGLVIDPDFHLTILGLNENVLVFILLAFLSLLSFVAVRGVERG
ncbi:MAG: hypothetical protein AAGA48_24530 [Myxococcota bacterium]